MKKWLNKNLGLRYWYSIRFIYKKDGIKIFDWVANYGLVSQSYILNSRYCKKLMPPLHTFKSIPKRLLNNGDMSTEVVAYLGWFKK